VAKTTRIALLTVVLVTLSCIASLTARAAVTDASTDEQAVRHVEDEIAAALGHNDADALSTLWGPDYTFVNPAGIVLTGAQRLAMLRSGELKVETYSRDDESIRIYGTTAVVTYRSTVSAKRKDLDISSHRRVMTVLVKRDGRWQAVAQQSTIVVEKPAS
jgi:uncharacterized protein (TIGR02246 family)